MSSISYNHIFLNNQRTTWNKKLMVAQLVSKFPTYYGRFTAASTRDHHRALLPNSPRPHILLFKPHLKLRLLRFALWLEVFMNKTRPTSWFALWLEVFMNSTSIHHWTHNKNLHSCVCWPSFTYAQQFLKIHIHILCKFQLLTFIFFWQHRHRCSHSAMTYETRTRAWRWPFWSKHVAL
jgi:hypothetical protein